MLADFSKSRVVEAHEKDDRDGFLESPGQYALGQQHKHLPEMVKMTGISEPPVFSPIVGDFYAGMEVTVPLHSRALAKEVTLADIKEVFAEYYKEEKMIEVMDAVPEDGFIHGDMLRKTDD